MNRLLTSICILLAAAASAEGQTTTEVQQLARAASMRGDVVVEADDVATIRGQLVRIVDDELELATRGGPRWVPVSRVARITVPGDPLVDGVVRGVGVATVWCALTCERTSDRNVHAGAFVGRLAMGGAIGGLIDRAINGKRTLYQRRVAPTIHIGAGPRRGSVTIVF